MDSIDITVTKQLTISPTLAHRRLSEWRSFEDWWPFEIRYGDDTSGSFAVHPAPFIRIEWMPLPSDSDREIAYRYVRGPFRGTGTWLLEPIRTGVSISYRVLLTPVNRLVSLAASTALFRWKHRRDIARILDRLQASESGTGS